MDNEEDYIELHRLLARLKFNLVKSSTDLVSAQQFLKQVAYYEKKIQQIDEFIVDIPIIIKGDEKQ